MSAAQIRRRLLFTLLLALPVLVVCGVTDGFIDFRQEEAKCGEWQIRDFEATATAGSTTTTRAADSTEATRLLASEGAARVQAAVATGIDYGTSVAIQLSSPDDATPVSTSGSFRAETLCAGSTKEFFQSVLNVGGPVSGFDSGGLANATSSVTVDCGTTTSTYTPAFGGTVVALPFTATSVVCTLDVTYSADLTDGVAFLFMSITQLFQDLDFDGTGVPFDMDPEDPNVSLPPERAEVDRQSFGLHPWEFSRLAGSPPDLSNAEVDFIDVDPLNVINASDLGDEINDAIDEGLHFLRLREQGGCLVADAEADRCPIQLSADIWNGSARPAFTGSWFYVDDPVGPVDLFAPVFNRTLSAKEVLETRFEMLDPIIETLGTFGVVLSRVRGTFTQEGVSTLASDLTTSGTPKTSADLLLNGLAIVDFVTREGEPNPTAFTLVAASSGTDFFHLPTVGTQVTPLSVGDTAPSDGGYLLILNRNADLDGSGSVDPDEAITQIASFEVTSDLDLWSGRVVVPAGAVAIASESARLDCESSVDSGPRTFDACINTELTSIPFFQEFERFELQGVGCPDPLAADETCALVDIFPLGGILDIPVKMPPETEAVGCNQPGLLRFGGKICADLSAESDAIPGDCAIIGGEGCPNNCADVGGVCRGDGGSQFCSSVGASGCTDLSEANLCDSNSFCRPYTSTFGGVFTLPKIACRDTSDCLPSTVCGADGFCDPGVVCDATAAESNCGPGRTCFPIEDGLDSGSAANSGRCFDVASSPCFDDDFCGGGETCERISSIPATTPNSGLCENIDQTPCDTTAECGSQICVIVDGGTPTGRRGFCLDEKLESCDPEDPADPCKACAANTIEPYEKRACVFPERLVP